MKLFNLQFGSELKNTADLFYRGEAKYECGNLKFLKNETASFDTYFGLFSFSKYKKYCNINNVDLILNGSGDFLVDVIHRQKDGTDVPLSQHKFTDSANVQIDFSQLDDGYIYFSVTALTDATLYGGYYDLDKVQENHIKIGIVICTFKREEFVKNNLKRFLAGTEKEPVWKDWLHIFIIDNAKTLDLEKNDLYTVVPNKNLGGSGGFTRGICEVCDRPEFTHFLLMDDDIHFEFETLKRTFYLLRALSEEYKNSTVGGAMLYLDKPTFQHEFGGYFYGLAFRPINSRIDMSQQENLMRNEYPEQANYNAWWYTCMPVETVKKYGLPLPLFIKNDDVEYGLRSIENLINLNGIAIWHQDFSFKYNASLDYYCRRNELITTSLHSNENRFKLGFKLLYQTFTRLGVKRYYAAEVSLDAYYDFFKGCKFLCDADMEKLNSKLMSGHPKFIDKADLEKTYNVDIDKELAKIDKPKNKRNIFRQMLLTLENYFPAFMFKKDVVVVDYSSGKVKPLFRKKTSIHFDANRNQGYVCELDTKRRNKIRRKTIKMFFKIIFSYGKIKKEYKNNYLSACSREEWNKKFGI